jgi:predicted nucleic acid-binding protein
MGSGVLRPEQSQAAWEDFARDERVFEVAAVPPSLESRLRENVLGRAASPKLWTDAWLASLAESLGYEMVTYDCGFRNFALSSLRLLSAQD